MNKSISYLPSDNQQNLHFLVESTLSRIKQTEMIILLGNYVCNKYVVYDEDTVTPMTFLKQQNLIMKEKYIGYHLFIFIKLSKTLFTLFDCFISNKTVSSTI